MSFLRNANQVLKCSRDIQEGIFRGRVLIADMCPFCKGRWFFTVYGDCIKKSCFPLLRKAASNLFYL